MPSARAAAPGTRGRANRESGDGRLQSGCHAVAAWPRAPQGAVGRGEGTLHRLGRSTGGEPLGPHFDEAHHDEREQDEGDHDLE